MPLGFSDALVFILNLRSPSTTHPPRRPRLRRPIKISSPIVHESLHFNVNAVAMNSTTQPGERIPLLFPIGNTGRLTCAIPRSV